MRARFLTRTLALFLLACATTIERAPVENDPDVLLDTTGTVLLAERGDALLNRSVSLIALPSGARRELRMPSNFSDLSGIDERGRLATLAARARRSSRGALRSRARALAAR